MLNSIKDLVETSRVKIMTNADRPTYPTGEIDWNEFDKMREEYPICIDHEKDMISFKMLTKPASEGGNLALCQLTDLIEVALHMLKYLNEDYPCVENGTTITKLQEALMWQDSRTVNRKSRNVEGKYEK